MDFCHAVSRHTGRSIRLKQTIASAVGRPQPANHVTRSYLPPLIVSTLLHRLQYYGCGLAGVVKIVIQWIRSFLTDRTQQVAYNGSQSVVVGNVRRATGVGTGTAAPSSYREIQSLSLDVTSTRGRRQQTIRLNSSKTGVLWLGSSQQLQTAVFRYC